MVNPKKTQVVQELTEKLKKAKSLVLTDYTGLSVPQQQKLRNQVKKAGGEFIVTKNTLLRLALDKSSLTSNLSPLASNLIGPTATLFAFEDEIAPIKALAEFSQEFELPKIKTGFFEGKMIEKEAILELAKIPSRKELQAQLVYTINSPINELVNVLSADMRKLILVLTRGGEN